MKLPPYSPELNPIENVWAYLRGNTLSNMVYKTYIVGEGLPAWTEPAALRFCIPLVVGDADYPLIASDLVTLGDAPLPPIRPAVFIAIDWTG